MSEDRSKKLSTGLLVSTRRRFLQGALGAATLSAPALIFPGKARATEQIVITLWGGQMADHFQEVYLKPFTAETGIPVIDAGAPDLAKIKAMVRTGNVEWDVVLTLASWNGVGEREGLWEKIDYSMIDMSDALPGVKRDYGFCYEVAQGGVCWHKERNGGSGQHPSNWVEFFDAEKFPGRRGLRPRAQEILEIALLGDGVAPNQLYPLDVDRAFKSLDRLKPHVSNWIAATPQTITLIQQNECDFTYAYNGRVFAANNSGVPVDMTRTGNLVYLDYMTVVKGSKNKEAAMKLLAFIMRPDRQAAYANRVPFGPSNKKAIEMADPKVKPWFADPTDPANAVLSADYWGEKEEELGKRFKEWLLI